MPQGPAEDPPRAGRESTLLVAARARGIPWRRIPGPAAPMGVLGHGHKRRLVWMHFTAATSHVGTVASTAKPLTKSLLAAAGLPVPWGGVAADLEQALGIARRVGLPVAVKPVGTDHGVAVFTGVASELALREAFAMASAHGPVLVERHVPGEHVRLLVIGGHFAAAVQQTPAQVVGDGECSVARLVERANAGRADTLAHEGTRIVVDEQVRWLLAHQGLGLDAVPRAGEVVRLRSASNLGLGGTHCAVTDRVHPENRALAERAARVLELDVAGVDLMIGDVARPWHSQACGIVEVNPTPGMIMGEPPGRLENLWLDTMFPGGDDGRIPLIALLGTHPGVARALEAALARRGHRVALCQAPGVRVAGAVRAAGGLGLAARVGVALGDPDATAAVFDFGADARADPAALAGLPDAGLDRLDAALVPDDPQLPAAAAAALAGAARRLLTGAAPDGGPSQPWIARHPDVTRIDPRAGLDALVASILDGVPAPRRAGLRAPPAEGTTIVVGAGWTVAGGEIPPEEGPDSIGQGAG